MGANNDATTVLAVGSYADTDSLTLWRYDGEAASKLAAVDLASPSFVCWHPTLPVLYAVSELPAGQVTALAVDDDWSLDPIDATPTGGAEPCWVTCDPIGSALIIANYDINLGASSLAVLRLAADGTFTGDATVLRRGGSGPVADRQASSHMHQAVPTAYGTVLATDLGADRLVEFEVYREAATEIGRIPLLAGTGPRHVVVNSDSTSAFVTGELDGTITVLHRADGAWTVGERVPCTGDARVPGDMGWGEVYPSHLALTDLDRYLLVANRSVNTLAALDVSDGLRIVAETPIAAWPRHFAVVDDVVLVAAQHGDVVEAHRFDGAKQAFTALGTVLAAPGASCVAPSSIR